MDLLGLVYRAVRETVEVQVQRALDAFGQGEASAEPPSAKPEPPPVVPDPVEAPMPSFEVVDAVFPEGRPAEPVPGAAPGPETAATAGTASPAAAVPAEDPIQRVEPTAEESAAQEQKVLEVLGRRAAAMRGFEIAEGTGITPWWQLKEVLHRLVREGRVVQTEEGLFGLRADSDPLA